MTIDSIVVDGKIVKISTADIDHAAPLETCSSLSLERLLKIALLSSNSTQIAPRKWSSDSTEQAITRFALGNMSDIRKTWTQVFKIRFTSSNKYGVKVYRNPEDMMDFVAVKGAPTRVMDHCKKVFWDGKTVELTEERKEIINKRYEELGHKGRRVLGFAGFSWDGREHNYIENATKIEECKCPIDEELTFVGLMAMIDPPSAGVSEFVNTCHLDAMQLTILTGDHPITAEAIANEIGLLPMDAKVEKLEGRSAELLSDSETDYNGILIHGHNLRDLLEDAHVENFRKRYLTRKYKVFSRCSPAQKMKIIELMQEDAKLGELVMMLGDGVNDSPAIKKSDFGIAVLPRATAVTKSAADMHLLEEGTISDITTAIQTSRWAFQKIIKATELEYIHCVSMIFPIPIFVLFGITIDWFAFVAVIFNFFTKACLLFSIAFSKHPGSHLPYRSNFEVFGAMPVSKPYCFTLPSLARILNPSLLIFPAAAILFAIIGSLIDNGEWVAFLYFFFNFAFVLLAQRLFRANDCISPNKTAEVAGIQCVE